MHTFIYSFAWFSNTIFSTICIAALASSQPFSSLKEMHTYCNFDLGHCLYACAYHFLVCRDGFYLGIIPIDILWVKTSNYHAQGGLQMFPNFFIKRFMRPMHSNSSTRPRQDNGQCAVVKCKAWHMHSTYWSNIFEQFKAIKKIRWKNSFSTSKSFYSFEMICLVQFTKTL